MQTTSKAARAFPKQERALATYERLLDVAAELLTEVGFERISTNLICARAGMTPPALYRYFKDKYAVLEALGERLMASQNAIIDRWIAANQGRTLDDLEGATEQLLRETVEVTVAEPGAIWIMRALRAAPQVAHVRIESHRYVTDRLTDFHAPLLPHMPREVIWRRLRMVIEIGFAMNEMLMEEDRLSREVVVAETTRLLHRSLHED